MSSIFFESRYLDSVKYADLSARGYEWKRESQDLTLDRIKCKRVVRGVLVNGSDTEKYKRYYDDDESN